MITTLDHLRPATDLAVTTFGTLACTVHTFAIGHVDVATAVGNNAGRHVAGYDPNHLSGCTDCGQIANDQEEAGIQAGNK